MFVSWNGVFLEREHIFKGTSGSIVQYEEIQEPQNSIIPHMEPQLDQQVNVESTKVPQGPRRSSRTRHNPERYGFLITDNDDVMIVDQSEPITEAMDSPDSEKWLEAMKLEI